MTTNLDQKIQKIHRLSLIRDIYRALLNSGRTYAAFDEEKVYPLVEKLSSKNEILDPMSGYGRLMSYCSRLGVRTYGLEFNRPQYYWQLLNHPAHADILLKCVGKIESNHKFWPKCNLRATVSDDWFSCEAKKIIESLFDIFLSILNKEFACKKGSAENLALALILPFAGRLSCAVPADIATHVKKGGMCVFKDWEQDLFDYLGILRKNLTYIKDTAIFKEHIIKLGDCRNAKLPTNRFSAMITSPPYPNHRDFTTMFAPENACLAWLANKKLSFGCSYNEPIIGSNFVSGRNKPVVTCKVAQKFLGGIEQYKGSKGAQYDNKVYYLPYFEQYFSDLEKAYKNIMPALKKNFEGYIIVVNNTARNLVIPVAESIVEIWQEAGFSAEIYSAEETFHVGTKNPRARGLKAKHTEYTIKVWR